MKHQIFFVKYFHQLHFHIYQEGTLKTCTHTDGDSFGTGCTKYFKDFC